MKLQKLILSFYVGIITLSVATLSMSIAWYAASTRVSVRSIDITIDTDRELLISTEKDSGYVETINHVDLKETGVFIPVTTAYSSSWIDSKSDKPLFYDDSLYSEFEELDTKSPVESGYFTQKFYLQADDDLYVTIDGDKTSLLANVEYNKSYAKVLYDEYQRGLDEEKKKLSEEDIYLRLNELVKAMRYSILVPSEKDYSYAIIDPYKSEDTVYAGLLDNDTDHYYDYFERHSDHKLYERLYGDFDGDPSLIVYDEASENDSLFINAHTEASAFNARHKRGVKSVNLEKSIANGITLKKENSYKLEDFEKEKASKPYHFPVYRNAPQEIIVSIYIEGWDLDSVNYTMGATFISNLAFTIEREM